MGGRTRVATEFCRTQSCLFGEFPSKESLIAVADQIDDLVDIQGGIFQQLFRPIDAQMLKILGKSHSMVFPDQGIEKVGMIMIGIVQVVQSHILQVVFHIV